jgi:hypothetical protein
MKNMARCVNAQDEFDLNTVATCPLHYTVHICRGGESCDLTEDGTCCYTNKSFDGIAMTRAFTVEGLSDSSSNAVALTNSGRGVKRKASPVTDIMDLDTFTTNVHQGLMYVKEAVGPRSLEEEPLTDYTRSLFAKIHAVMTYNNMIQKTGNVTACNSWVESTIQVLRGAQGKSLIPNMTSTPAVKAIVIETMNTMMPSKQMWWAKRPCITRQWWA